MPNGADLAQSAYAMKGRDPEFAERWEDAVEEAVASLEEEAWTRARDGRPKAIYQGGKLVGYEQVRSDALIVTLLKALRPDKYRENVKIEATVRTVDSDEESIAKAQAAIPVLQRVIAGSVKGSTS